MNILRRLVPTAEAAAEATVSRRIEVTVERETVTMLVRGQPKEGTEEPVMVDSGPESEFPQTPSFPPALKNPLQVCPACGSRSMVLLPETLPVLDQTSLQQGSDAPMSTSIVPHPANGGFTNNRLSSELRRASMPGYRLSTQSIPRRFLRILAPLAAGVALLVLPQQAWGVEQFTVSNNIFPPSGSPPTVGSSIHQTVTVTLSGSPVAIKSIVLQSAGATVSGVAEYTLGTITGCTLDPTGVTTNPLGTVCSIPVTYKPAYPGSLASPLLSRNATLVLTDGNDSKTWTFALTGAATGPLTQLVPGTLIRYAGAAYTETGINPLDYGLGLTTGAYSEGNGQANSAQFSFFTNNGLQDQYMTLDSAGNLYVIDNNNYIIRKIDNTTNHNVTTIAGTPQTGGYSGDGGAAINAKLAYPSTITLDATGNIYFLDNTNTFGSGYVRLRRIDAVSGLITPVAGQNYSGTYDTTDGGGSCTGGANSWTCGDGGLATYAELGAGIEPGATDMAIDPSGNIYLWSRWGTSIREISASNGKINTIASAANFNSVGSGGCVGGGGGGMTLASDGNLYVVTMDCTLNGGNGAYVIKEFNITNSPGTVTTVAGGGTNISTGYGTSGQGGVPAGNLYIYGTYGGSGLTTNLASDASGNLYLPSGQAIFRINLATQTAYCVMFQTGTAGTATNTDESFNAFSGYYIDPFTAIPDNAGNLYVMTYNQIAEINGSSAALYFSPGSSGLQDFSTSADQIITFANVGNASETAPVHTFASSDSVEGTNFGTDPFPTIPTPAGNSADCTAASSVAVDAACTFYLQFSPTAVGALSDTLDLGNPLAQSVTLSGNGTAYPQIGLNQTSLSFGNVTENTSATQYVTISNTGTATLTVNDLESNGTNFSNFVVAAGGTSPCTITSNSITLTAGSSCTIKVTFTPTAAISYTGAYLEGAANTTASSSTLLNLAQYKLIPFTGTGVSAPATAPIVSITPSSYVFPATTAQSGYQSGNGNPAVTLTNIGNAPLTFTGLTPFMVINGGTSSPFSVYPNGSCTETYVDFGTPLPATDNCTITVQFWPQSAGAFQATLSVADNAANSPQTITFSGVGKAGQLQFAPAQLNAFTAVSTGSCHDSVTQGSSASSATICMPSSAATDQSGNTYIADWEMNVIRKVNSSGNISDYAGYASSSGIGPGCVGKTDSLGDGCPALDATLSNPGPLAVDGAGNLYISDLGNNRVREVNAVTGIITTFVGGGGSSTFTAGQGAAVSLPVTYGIAIDPSGNLYVATYGQNLVIKVDPSGNATIFAGVAGQSGYNGDNILATSAKLNNPVSVATDLSGNVYIADTLNYRVRKVDTTGNITTVAGNGTGGDTGDGSAATNAEIWPISVAVDPAGEIYIGAVGVGGSTDVVRKVDLSGNITTIAGGGSGSALPAQATSVSIPALAYIGLDAAGDVLIPSGSGLASAGPQGDLVFGSISEGSTSSPLTVTVTNTGNAAVYFYNPNSSGAVPGAPSRAAAIAGAPSGAAVSEGTSFGGGVGTVTGDFAIASGGTCNLTTSGSIAAGASCTINVTFSPTQTGARPGNITLYADGPNNIPAVINLSGTGTAPALTAQTINFPNPGAQTLGTPLALTATATSGLTVAFSSTTTEVCTVSGTQTTFLTTGTCTIDANQAGNSTYAAAPMVPQSFTVNAEAQTITFNNPGAQTLGTPLALTATATSGLTVAFSSTTTGVCTVSGTQATFLTTGTCTIDANQAGNSTYAAAPMVPQSFTVNAAPVPSFTVTSPTAPQTVQHGGAATYTINVNPVNGSYTGAVTLSVVQSTLPTGATASFSQNPVTPGSEGTSSTLTIQTAALTASNSGSSWPLAAPALALIGLFFLPGKRRRRWLMMGALLLGSLGALTALSGCGGGFWLSTSTPYTITVNGANSGGVIVSTTTVQLTVQ